MVSVAFSPTVKYWPFLGWEIRSSPSKPAVWPAFNPGQPGTPASPAVPASPAGPTILSPGGPGIPGVPISPSGPAGPAQPTHITINSVLERMTGDLLCNRCAH